MACVGGKQEQVWSDKSKSSVFEPAPERLPAV